MAIMMQLVDQMKKEPTKRGLGGGFCSGVNRNWDKQSLSVLRAMSVSDVAEWVGAKANLDGGAIWSAVFVKHHITGWVLPYLSEHDLKYELGMTRIDTRKKFQLALEQLRQVCETVSHEEDEALLLAQQGTGIAFNQEPPVAPLSPLPRRKSDSKLAQAINLEAGLYAANPDIGFVDEGWESADVDPDEGLKQDEEWA